MKKKTLVPLIVFLLGICLVSFIVYKTDTHEREQRHITAQLNAATYGERIKNEITDGIEITNALGQILISENGEIHPVHKIHPHPDIRIIAELVRLTDLVVNRLPGNAELPRNFSNVHSTFL